MPKPVRAPKTVETATGGTLEHQKRQESVEGSVSSNAPRALRGGHDPVEMGRRGGLAAASTQTREIDRLRTMSKRQEEIALGKVAGATATQQTQAAKAYLDLSERIAELDEAAESEIPWDQIGAARRQLVLVSLEVLEEMLEDAVASLLPLTQSRPEGGEERAR